MNKQVLLSVSIAAVMGLSACSVKESHHENNQSATLPDGTTLISSVSKTSNEIVIPFKKFQLDNGLTIVLHPDKSEIGRAHV